MDEIDKSEPLEYGNFLRSSVTKKDDSVEESETIEDVEPLEEGNVFSMTSFGSSMNYVEDLGESDNTIVEINGIYSISEKLEIKQVNINADFKRLVDSVLDV